MLDIFVQPANFSKDTLQGGHFPVFRKFPNFSRCLQHTSDAIVYR